MKKEMILSGLCLALLFAACSQDKNSSGPSEGEGTVTDIDGNVYNTVQIGSQVWMAENLKVTRFRNGNPIPEEPGEAEWAAAGTPLFCMYDNDPSNTRVYGLLYNWFAADDPRGLAPAGWHVPSDEEWKTLEMELGMSRMVADAEGAWRGTDQGGQLKEQGTAHWEAPNSQATNSSGFTALPHGYRSGNGGFYTLNQNAPYHTSTEKTEESHWFHLVRYEESGIFRDGTTKKSGYAVRCVRD